MGHCLSLHLSAADEPPPYDSPTAKVISISGGLREYALPITAAQVIASETETTETSAFFLCNSDRLSYDDRIPALSPADGLYPSQIYFVLPRSKLDRRLAASDMAALAVKANLALRSSGDGSVSSSRRRRRWRRSKTQISPALTMSNNDTAAGDYYYQRSFSDDGYDPSKTVKSFDSKPASIDRSGSVRKMQRLSSKRVKLAVRSFRMRLSTIYEGSVL